MTRSIQSNLLRYALVILALALLGCGVRGQVANEDMIAQKKQCDAAGMDSVVLHDIDSVPVEIRCVPKGSK